VILEPV
jgi:hypothetical protein